MDQKKFDQTHQLSEPEKQKSYRWHILLAIFLVLGVTIGILFYIVDFNSLGNLKDIHFIYLVLAGLAALLGIWIDANRLVQMAKLTGDSLSQNQSLQVVLGNYFFSFFTPAASGGPIAQYLILKKHGITSGKATLFIIARTLASLAVMVLFLPFIFYSESNLPVVVPDYLPILIFFLFLGIIGISFWLIRSPWFIRWSRGQLYMWAPQKLKRRLLRLHQDLSAVAFLFSTSPKIMLIVFGQTAASLTISYSMILFLFIGFGVTLPPLFALGRMFLLNFLIHFAPTPGGSGIAEGLFILLFAAKSSQTIAGINALLWRILSEYIPACFGLISMVHLFGYQYIKNKFWDTGKEEA